MDLISKVSSLSAGQKALIESIIDQLLKPHKFSRHPDSDIIDEYVLDSLGEALVIHHCFSKEPFTKDKFEYALERAFLVCGRSAKLATRGNPGHDITVGDWRISLKTQADRSIRLEKLHISKFMELGKGEWDDNPDDLKGLLNQFFSHMEAYDRILSMRRLSQPDEQITRYELVEIPKALLLEAEHGVLEMRMASKQRPKPGYCFVRNPDGSDRFQLYFDGGTERKLQIKCLDKRLCVVHASWAFGEPLD